MIDGATATLDFVINKRVGLLRFVPSHSIAVVIDPAVIDSLFCRHCHLLPSKNTQFGSSLVIERKVIAGNFRH